MSLHLHNVLAYSLSACKASLGCVEGQTRFGMTGLADAFACLLASIPAHSLRESSLVGSKRLCDTQRLQTKLAGMELKENKHVVSHMIILDELFQFISMCLLNN